MRLIDADKLIDFLDVGHLCHPNELRFSELDVVNMLNHAPTAYDVDAVVEQLEDYGNEETRYYKNTPYEKCIEECIGKAIEIVKGGGVDAKTDS